MKKILLISVLFLTISCKAQKCANPCNWDSLASSVENQLDQDYHNLEQKRHVLNDLISVVNRLKDINAVALQDKNYSYSKFLTSEIWWLQNAIENLKIEFTNN